MTINQKFIFILLASISLTSCELKGLEADEQASYVVKADESTNIHKLGKLINLEKFRPEKVEYHHTYIENINGLDS